MPARTPRRRSAGALIGLLGLILTGAAAWAIVAQDSGDGPVVALTESHGLHRDELIELGALVGGVALGIVGLWLWRPRP